MSRIPKDGGIVVVRAYCVFCQGYHTVTQDEDGVLWCDNCGSEILDENLMKKIREVNNEQRGAYQVRSGQNRREK